MTTANITAWAKEKEGESLGKAGRFIQRYHASVILSKEHKLVTDAEVAAADEWCRRNGWSARWSRATASTEAGEASGGTAVHARECIGVAEAKDILPGNARRCAAILDIPDGR